MSNVHTVKSTIKPTDLRGILEYVPVFRDHVFIIALDGSLIAHENFQNVLLDIAVLRSLNIQIVLVYRIEQQLQELSQSRQIPITAIQGEGKTDAHTLALSVEASAIVSAGIMQGLTRNNLRYALTNAVRSKEAGVIKGEDQLFSGVVDKINTAFLNQILKMSVVPLVAPIAFTQAGNPLHINSDSLAAELALELDASKLIYMTTEDGPQLNGQLLKNLPLDELDAVLNTKDPELTKHFKNKALCAAKAIHAGVPRAHILDGRLFGSLLNEIFDKVGIGTMIYGNAYQSIRPAVKADAYAIYTIVKNGVRTETLLERSQTTIEANIDDFLVYEIDGSIVGCICLQDSEQAGLIEIGSVYVQPFYQKKGVGKRMIEYVENHAKQRGAQRLLALTTQAASFFTRLCGFSEGNLDDLPPQRKAEYQANGRNSKILYKDIS